MTSTIFATFLAASLLTICQSVGVDFNRSGDAGYLNYLHGLRVLVSEHGCDIDLCFALDGGSKVTAEEFKFQKDFIDIIMQITQVDKRINYCAVQYGDSMRPISALQTNRRQFLKSVANAKQVGGTGISTTATALRTSERFLEKGGKGLRKIVALGAGWEHIGTRTKKVASRILEHGTIISTIAIGASDLTELNLVTGDPQRSLTLEKFADLPVLASSVVIDVCGFL